MPRKCLVKTPMKACLYWRVEELHLKLCFSLLNPFPLLFGYFNTGNYICEKATLSSLPFTGHLYNTMNQLNNHLSCSASFPHSELIKPNFLKFGGTVAQFPQVYIACHTAILANYGLYRWLQLFSSIWSVSTFLKSTLITFSSSCPKLQQGRES